MGGGFAQYVRAMPPIVQRGMIRIADGVTFEEATFIEPVNTCLKAIRKARIGQRRCCVRHWTGTDRPLAYVFGARRRRNRADQRSTEAARAGALDA